MFYRKLFLIKNEEIFQLFGERVLSEINGFLELEFPSQMNISKSSLISSFTQNYYWLRRKPSESIDKVDGKCQGLYELTIYKSVKDNNTFSFNQIKYPLRFKLKI